MSTSSKIIAAAIVAEFVLIGTGLALAATMGLQAFNDHGNLMLAVSAAERAGRAPPPERGRLIGLKLMALQLAAVYLWAALLARIYELFPSGPGKGACKMAGLPKPTGCV